MSGELDVPILITKETVQLAQGRVALFIAPCELSVLEMGFLELTCIQGVAKANEAASVNISMILVPGLINLVEISVDYPFGARSRLLRGELLEEGVFVNTASWAINRG